MVSNNQAQAEEMFFDTSWNEDTKKLLIQATPEDDWREATQEETIDYLAEELREYKNWYDEHCFSARIPPYI